MIDEQNFKIYNKIKASNELKDRILNLEVSKKRVFPYRKTMMMAASFLLIAGMIGMMLTKPVKAGLVLNGQMIGS